MPFPDVDGKNFEEVINGVLYYVRPLIKAAKLEGDYKGWSPDKYISALSSMVGDSSDRLWSAAIDDQGQSKADKLASRVEALELIVSRLNEQLSTLQVRK
jgi:hypothetical protein